MINSREVNKNNPLTVIVVTTMINNTMFPDHMPIFHYYGLFMEEL